MALLLTSCQFKLHENGLDWGVMGYKDNFDVRQVTQNLSKKEIAKLRIQEKTKSLIEKYKEVYPLEFSFFISLFFMVLPVCALRKKVLLKTFLLASAIVLTALIVAYARESGWKLYLHYYRYWKSGYETFISYLTGSLRQNIKLEVTIALNICAFNVLLSLVALRAYFWESEDFGF